jgi:hypothetical protein
MGSRSRTNVIATPGGEGLPVELLAGIEAEARARRRKPESLVREWLEDLADARAVEAARKYNKGKPNITLEQYRAKHGL